MNDDFNICLKILSFFVLIFGPVGIIVVGYVCWRDFHLYPEIPLGKAIGLELFFIFGTVFSYLFIKKMSWDFWRREKPKKIKLTTPGKKWWEEKN